jgi:hypothetical protein
LPRRRVVNGPARSRPAPSNPDLKS